LKDNKQMLNLVNALWIWFMNEFVVRSFLSRLSTCGRPHYNNDRFQCEYKMN